MESENTIKCSYCGAEIPKDVQKCKHCGEWVMTSEIPAEINRFNWGAFLLNWIWGIMHGKYITLLYFVACLIPVLGPLAISIWFGFAGNKWAWKSKPWKSVEEFNNTQRNWVKLWIILFTLGLIITIKIVLILLLVTNIEA